MSKPIFERKNILVTGGAGFLGSHLCDRLVKEHKVICIDNFKTGNEDNINHLLKHPDFEFIKHDLIKSINLEELQELKVFKVAFQGLQEIYHLACPTSPAVYKKYPLETLLANTHATRNALDLAVKYRAKFILFSSDAVYGQPTEDKPLPENYWGYVDPIGPDSSFAEGKRAAESLVYHYRQVYNIDAKIVRIFPTYGPRLQLKDGRLIPEIIRQAITESTINLADSKDARLSLSFFSDTLDAVDRMMNSNEHGPVNVGNDSPTTIGEVAELVKKLSEMKVNIKYNAGENKNIYRLPNIQFARQRLGWFPVISLAEGIRQTISYLKATYIQKHLST
ncbi:MAG: NAD-dependent epimerase/dehydratase family protein [Patescibacteria group bacterium]